MLAFTILPGGEGFLLRFRIVDSLNLYVDWS